MTNSKSHYAIFRCSLSSSSNSDSPDEIDEIKENAIDISKDTTPLSAIATNKKSPDTHQSGLFLYVDLHGHASKKGKECFDLINTGYQVLW